jgi:3D (Asp-Asp-Asp) domain-containing protein
VGEKVKAKFTAYYPSNEGVEGGYYDCQGVLLSTYLNNGTNVVAAPKECAINSKIKISGTGTSRDGGVYLVRDRGGAINVNSDGTYCFDILTANKKEANAWGVRYGYAELDVEGSTSGSTSTVTTKYWVGDSRFDAIKSMASSNDTFICKVGAGYSWFTNTAVPKLKSELKNASGEVVILAMGVNDLHNKSNYVSAYKSLMSSYSNVKFLVVSVNPVCDSKSEYAKNSDIEAFNSTLQSNFPNNYIDVYSKIKDQVNDSSTDSE